MLLEASKNEELSNEQVHKECKQDDAQQHEDAEDEDSASAVFADADGDIFPHLPDLAELADLAGIPHMQPASRKHTRHGTSLVDTYVPNYNHNKRTAYLGLVVWQAS